MTERFPEIEEVLDEVEFLWAGYVDTHYSDCYLRHAACLARLVREMLRD